MTNAPAQPAARPLTTGQAWMLGAATIPMLGFGILGAVGTYTNIKAVFPQSATALGVVAAGEGATFVLALVYVGLTMLGQSSPGAVRLGLWALPAMASGTGAVVAQGSTSAVVYAVTPMAMCVSAEGIGLLARRIVVRTTGVDMEAQRRNAATMQKLAYQRARAANHPDEKVKGRAERKAWRLARKVGVGDTQLGVQLVAVQRERMTEGADATLAGMFTPTVTAPVAPDRHAIETVTEAVTAPVTESVTEDLRQPPTAPQDEPPVTPVTDPVAPPVTDPVTQVSAATDTEPSRPSTPTVTLAELASVAGVTEPVPTERLTYMQLMVVLRYLRYQDDPPLSYRQAGAAFRDAGYVGSEERVRKAWGELLSQEEADRDTLGEEIS